MTPDRFARIETLYHAARARSPDARPAFLAEACGADKELRLDVESLLEQHGQTLGFLSPAVGAPRPALVSGMLLGNYRVVGQIGAGGMGEVYKAHDTRLGRNVALKVLPAAAAADPDRLARLEREARLLASLNHPHIAQIYGLEESNGIRGLVMELVESQTLAQRIDRGAVPVADALAIARQITDALEAAHQHGIIHRDLKPSNIALGADRAVKVLDFGLAKVENPRLLDRSHPPTLTAAATQTGFIAGTAAYMSPEGVRGQVVNNQTDIWAFGCVLYEMLTGRMAFPGATTSDHIAAIIEREPDWSLLPLTTPPAIRRLLRRCLEKDSKWRLHDIADARLELNEDTETAGQPGLRTFPAIIAIAMAIALAAVLSAAWLFFGTRRSSPTTRLTVELGAPASMASEVGPNVALSSDGGTLAFVALTRESHSTQLYVRRLDQLNAVPLSGTDDARNPFFSPDGRWIAFFDQLHFKLKKVSVDGGPPVTLSDVRDWRGGDWTDDNSIVFQASPNRRAPLLRVAAEGGPPQPFVNAPEIAGSVRWPQVLPGGKALLYTAGVVGQFERGDVMAQTLPRGTPHVVLHDAYYGRYVNTGHLLYMHNGTVFAAPFNSERLEVTGPPVPVLEGVNGSIGTGSGEFAVSRTGVLLYVPTAGTGDAVSSMDRSGAVAAIRVVPGIWTNPAFSPDGNRLALQISDGTQFSIWVYDLARDTQTKVTFEDSGFTRPVWTPDGRRLAFGLRHGGALNLFWMRADGTGAPQRLATTDLDQEAYSWHPSGHFLAYVEMIPGTKSDLMLLPVSGDETSGFTIGKPRPLLSSPAHSETDPMFSPDGHWIAYTSAETGRAEVFVIPFPGKGSKMTISSGGGRNPQWSPSTHELLYRGADNRIMVTAYRAVDGSFLPDRPRLWSPRALPAGIMRPLERTPFAVYPDGKRIALFVPPDPAPGQRDKVVLVTNFFNELAGIGQSAAR